VFDLIGLGFLHLAGFAAVALWWALLFPMLSVPVLASITVGVLVGWPAGAVAAGASVAGIMLWRWKCPHMFERLVTRRARTRFLTWWRYRRHWALMLHVCRLTLTYPDGMKVPALQRVSIGTTADTLLVRMLAGQCPADWEHRTEHLAHAFGASECAARLIGPALFELTFRRCDTLAEPIRLPRLGLGSPAKGEAA
jgi:S-DNA-T family DNA segregation ATPase FtsK/SpoIIIE